MNGVALSGVLTSVQFVEAPSGHRLAIMDADDWGGLIEWLEDIEDRQIIRSAIASTTRTSFRLPPYQSTTGTGRPVPASAARISRSFDRLNCRCLFTLMYAAIERLSKSPWQRNTSLVSPIILFSIDSILSISGRLMPSS